MRPVFSGAGFCFMSEVNISNKTAHTYNVFTRKKHKINYTYKPCRYPYNEKKQ